MEAKGRRAGCGTSAESVDPPAMLRRDRLVLLQLSGQTRPHLQANIHTHAHTPLKQALTWAATRTWGFGVGAESVLTCDSQTEASGGNTQWSKREHTIAHNHGGLVGRRGWGAGDALQANFSGASSGAAAPLCSLRPAEDSGFSGRRKNLRRIAAVPLTSDVSESSASAALCRLRSPGGASSAPGPRLGSPFAAALPPGPTMGGSHESCLPASAVAAGTSPPCGVPARQVCPRQARPAEPCAGGRRERRLVALPETAPLAARAGRAPAARLAAEGHRRPCAFVPRGAVRASPLPAWR